MRHFLRSRRWAHAHPESTAGGVTWLELFTLFDLPGVRTIKGQHIKDTAATERARIRKSKGRHAEAKGGRRKGNLILTSAVVKPTLDEEMKRFKAIVRYITSHDLPHDQSKWFRLEPRAALRRLAPLGIDGNQPAIAGYCQITGDAQREITKALLLQKIGANPQATKIFNELDTRQQNTTKEEAAAMTILFRKARIAGGAIIRWKRNISKDPSEEAADEANRDEEDQTRKAAEDSKAYTSRMLACTRCGAAQETAWMQLRTRDGFRAVHCRTCRLQERSINNKCQCGLIWHHCPTHRIDPSCHRSRKAPKKSLEEKKKEQEAMRQKAEARRKRSINDKPPEVEQGQNEIRRRRGTRRGVGDRNYQLKTMKAQSREVKMHPGILARLRSTSTNMHSTCSKMDMHLLSKKAKSSEHSHTKHCIKGTWQVG